jgi:hypothetical protein
VQWIRTSERFWMHVLSLCNVTCPQQYSLLSMTIFTHNAMYSVYADSLTSGHVLMSNISWHRSLSFQKYRLSLNKYWITIFNMVNELWFIESTQCVLSTQFGYILLRSVANTLVWLAVHHQTTKTGHMQKRMPSHLHSIWPNILLGINVCIV